MYELRRLTERAGEIGQSATLFEGHYLTGGSTDSLYHDADCPLLPVVIGNRQRYPLPVVGTADYHELTGLGRLGYARRFDIHQPDIRRKQPFFYYPEHNYVFGYTSIATILRSRKPLYQ